jgi:hypothetical protein
MRYIFLPFRNAQPWDSEAQTPRTVNESWNNNPIGDLAIPLRPTPFFEKGKTSWPNLNARKDVFTLSSVSFSAYCAHCT